MKILLPLTLCLLIISAALSHTTGSMAGAQAKGQMGLFTPSEIQRKEGPASLKKGAKMIVMEGDPSKEGMFTMRLWFPDGFEVAPHWHTQVEHVTIISGTLNFGMG